MKKILLLCSIAFMFSCSNDTETSSISQNENVENVSTTASRPLPPVEDDIDAMFYSYVTSDDYINLQNKIFSFNSKLQLPQGIEFESRAQLLLWIEANLSSTTFLSIEDATIDWDEIISLQDEEPEKFTEVYEFLVDAPEEIVVAALDKWFNLKDLPINTTTTDCEKSFRSCTNNANFRYFSMSRSFSQDSQIMAEAKAQQDRALEWCRDLYIGCVNN